MNKTRELNPITYYIKDDNAFTIFMAPFLPGWLIQYLFCFVCLQSLSLKRFCCKRFGCRYSSYDNTELNFTYLHTCCRYNYILTGCINSCTSLRCWHSRHWLGNYVNHWYIHSRLEIKIKCLRKKVCTLFQFIGSLNS